MGKQILLLWVVLLLTTACKKEEENEASPTPIKIQQVQADSVVHDRIFSGTLEAYKTHQISFMVPGDVATVQVTEGDRVQKGETLATIGSNEYRQAYEAAKARVDQASDQYRRLKNMYESNSLTKGDLLEITSKKKEAEAKLAQYRQKLQKTTLEAPAPGLIKRVSIAEGEVVEQGLPGITLIQSDRLYATFNIPESDISLLSVGDTCQVTFGGVNVDAMTQTSRIEKIKPTANPLSRSFKAYAVIDNKEKNLKPGMLAQIHINGLSMDYGIVVSPELLVHRDNTLNIWTMTNGRATLNRVLTAQLTDYKIQITQGLQPDDTLIVSGGMNLHEGEKVEVVE